MLRRLALRVGVLMMPILALVVTACGAPPEEPKLRLLPEDPQTLSPGTYRSEEFEPSLSFTLGEGWTNGPPETRDKLTLTWGQTWLLQFVKPRAVYEPTKTRVPKLVETPEDMVGWYRRHPYLRTSKPEPVTVGGVGGEKFDVVVAEDVPEDHYYGVCGPDCVEIARLEQADVVIRHPPQDRYGACASACVDPFWSSSGSLLSMRAEEKQRLMVLEDAKGEPVTMGFASPVDEFDMFAPEAQKVLDSIEWQGA
jgi:hypothetical protein